ncbi:MAG: energy-coupling factor transporter transmembrane component T [Streptosporangiales bacterium]
MRPRARLARGLHPVAWWLWALGLAVAASRTTNPVLLALVLVVAALVVTTRRGDAPWARGFRSYLLLGLIVIAIRVVFHALLGTSSGQHAHVLVRLPELPLPAWAAGIEIGGPVVLEGVLGACYAGLRLAVLLACIGAANVLANPKRALRVLPGALYEIGVSVVVALTVAPQIVESGQRVLRARRLRGDTRRWLSAVRGIAVPVLQDALARSLSLAAAMDSRGYGRTAGVSARSRRASAALLLAGLLGLAVGAYGVLAGDASYGLGLPVLLAGAACCCAGLLTGGRRVRHSRYRPDPWGLPESLVAGSGVAAACVMVVAAGYAPGALTPSLYPLGWPTVSLLPLAGLAVAALPAVAAPPTPRVSVRTPPPTRDRLPEAT